MSCAMQAALNEYLDNDVECRCEQEECICEELAEQEADNEADYIMRRNKERD